MSMPLEYTYPTAALLTGGSYSNQELFTRLHAATDLAGVWSASDDQHYCGKWQVRVYVDGQAAEPRLTRLAPAFQTTEMECGGVRVAKTFLVPEDVAYRHTVYFLIDLENVSAEPHTIMLTGDISYPEQAWMQFSKIPDLYQKLKKVISRQQDGLVISHTQGRENEVRVIASQPPLQQPFFDDKGVQYLTDPFILEPGEKRTLHATMTFSNQGEPPAVQHVHLDGAVEEARARTLAWWDRFLRITDITTPSPVLNRGLAWAKINMGRQRVHYPCGWGFTNDPPQDVLVVRDAAWFILGSDYLMPDFSMGMLELLLHTAVEPGGKMTEYVLTCESPPYRYDYGLNVNDNTPLFVIAVWHHYLTTGNEVLTRTLYPVARDAANYMLSQRMGQQGLVYCTSEEANVWGIAGWRNIIPGYQQNGAVTEINAETVWALECLAELAAALGFTSDSDHWHEQAADLRERINRFLISSETGLYVVNIDTAGVRHDQLTGDMVFPLLAGVADSAMARRTLQALYQPEFWTPYGVRTVAKGQPGYDPEYGMRLVGGIWPNLTAWVAYASRELYPEKMVEAMENIYRICEVPVPRDFRNVVPGQFPECMHGENFESRGMSLSPWMPATYLWVALEGMLGLRPRPDGMEVTPHLPARWHWMGVRNMPWRGRSISIFVADGVIYSTEAVTSPLPVEVYEEDITDRFGGAEGVIALRRGEEVAVFIPAPTERQVELHIPAEITGRERTLRVGLETGAYTLLRL